MFKRTRDYAKDYERAGKSVRYTGKYYRFSLAQPELSRRKAAYLLLLLAASGLYLALGLSGSAAFGGAGRPAAVYVVLPFIGLLLPLGLGIARALLLIVKSKPLEYAEYDKYLVQQKGVFVGMLVLCGALALGTVVFLLINGGAGMREVASLIESIACFACIFVAFREYHTLFNSITIDESIGLRYDI